MTDFIYLRFDHESGELHVPVPFTSLEAAQKAVKEESDARVEQMQEMWKYHQGNPNAPVGVKMFQSAESYGASFSYDPLLWTEHFYGVQKYRTWAYKRGWNYGFILEVPIKA